VTPIVFLCSAIRAEIADLNRVAADCPVRAPVVQDRLERVVELVEKVEEHGATERVAAND